MTAKKWAKEDAEANERRTEPDCLVQSGELQCTRKKGHGGIHVAGNGGSCVLKRWPQAKAKAKKKKPITITQGEPGEKVKPLNFVEFGAFMLRLGRQEGFSKAIEAAALVVERIRIDTRGTATEIVCALRELKAES